MQTEKTVSCFDRPLIAKWSDRPLASLTTEWLEDVQETLHDKHGFDAYRKFRAYGNAALNWAQEFKRRESGLDGRRWWLLAEKRRRKSKEVTAKLERDKKLKQKKAAFQVGHLGELLVEHEKFCLSRTGNERISPGVRWGLGGIASPAIAVDPVRRSLSGISSSRIPTAIQAGDWRLGSQTS